MKNIPIECRLVKVTVPTSIVSSPPAPYRIPIKYPSPCPRVRLLDQKHVGMINLYIKNIPFA